MPLPTSPTSSWVQGLDFPSRVFGTGSDDYELYEEDGEFVLSIDLPGFAREEIDVRWQDGRLAVAAEHEDESANRKRTYHRTFRFPKHVEEAGITAEYANGVLEIRLPVADVVMQGQQIEVQ
jgi:HSP20 family protein